MAKQSFSERLIILFTDPTARHLLLLRMLRILNFTALILAFWPLVLAAEWMDRQGMPNGYWTSGLICLGFGIAALISMIPLLYRQAALRKLDDGTEVSRESANLSEIEAALYPEQPKTKPTLDNLSPGRHSARALGEVDAYKAWRRQTRQYWLHRIMGTVGINVIRVLMMLVSGLVFAYVGYRIGVISTVILSVSALLLTLYTFDIPNRSYGDIFKSSHFTMHIGMVLMFQLVRTFLGFPLQPDFHLFILFYLTFVFFLTRNQTNIDNLMRQGARSLHELPHGLRSFNARLTSLLIFTFPVIYIARRPIATVLRFLWDTVVFAIAAVLNFLNSLFPESEEIPPETVETGGPTDVPPEAAEGGYWFRTIVTAIIITLIIYILRRFGRQMIAAIAEGLRRLKRFVLSLFGREPEESEEVEEGRYYTDYHIALDPASKHAGSYRHRKNRWKQDYKKYKRQYRGLPITGENIDHIRDELRYREAYALALRWLDLREESGLELSETVREIAFHHGHRLSEDMITSPDHFEKVTVAYEDVRYGVVDSERYQESFDIVLNDLEEQLGRMAERL